MSTPSIAKVRLSAHAVPAHQPPLLLCERLLDLERRERELLQAARDVLADLEAITAALRAARAELASSVAVGSR